MRKERFDAYSNYYYKIDKKKNKKATFLSLLFVIISILIVVFFSISFSNFLVVSKIVNVNSNYIYEDRILYAISLDKTTNIQDADKKAENIKKQGGAGYKYKKDDNIYILTSVYNNLKDAESVKVNLHQSNVECEIVTIEMPKIDIKITLSNKSRQILNKGIELFYSNYQNLYNLSVGFDKNEIDIIGAKNSIKDILKSNNEIMNDYKNCFNKASNIYILYVKMYFNRLNETLQNLLNLDESTNFTSELKYAYCSIIDCYLNLYDEMN